MKGEPPNETPMVGLQLVSNNNGGRASIQVTQELHDTGSVLTCNSTVDWDSIWVHSRYKRWRERVSGVIRNI